MFVVLLSIHLISAAIWLGGAVYERFVVVQKARKVAGKELELELIKLFISTSRIFVPAVVLLLLSGIALTAQEKLAFFSGDWLGMKQVIMSLIILGFVFVQGPRNGKLSKQIEQDRQSGGIMSETTRQAFNRLYVGFDLIHIGVVINVLLAVWKPL
ncbi:DUF2269 family protein [Cohnella sp. CFH 77786]|uniref:DUF2269 family protein n=1 Tax=Cohnella sp. CFH 77786 TaxID=2662265 RepID=UPI001C60E39B